MTISVPQCATCKNHISGSKCKAYDFIPVMIITNELDHKKKLPGDNGIRYEEVEDDK